MNTQTKVILAFVSLFTIGFASGFLFSKAISPTPWVNGPMMEQAEIRHQGQGRLDRNRSNRQADRMRNRVINLLDLTGDQQDIFFEHMAAYRSEIRSDIRDMRSRENELILEHYNTFRSDLQNILTYEQMQKLDEHLHPDSVRHQRRGGGPRR